MTVGNQLTDLMLFISIGFAAGFIFDFYYMLKRFFRLAPWLHILLDFTLWVFITIITAFFLVLVNWGEVRLYVFLAMGAGLTVYYLLLSSIVKKVYGFFMDKSLRVIKFIKRSILRFFRFIFKPLGRILKKLFGPVYLKILKGKKKIIAILKPLRKKINKVKHKRRILLRK